MLPPPHARASARVLGLRFLQLQSESLAQTCGDTRARAVRELLDGRCAFVLRRTMPDGTFDDVRVAELTLPDDLRAHLEYILECQSTDPGY